jgi:hypothetical protein
MEQLKLLFDSINKDAKTAFLVILLVAIYVLYRSIGSSNTEFDAVRKGQIQDLTLRLANCETHGINCANRIDAMYSILKKQDSIIIELNAAVRYKD